MTRRTDVRRAGLRRIMVRGCLALACSAATAAAFGHSHLLASTPANSADLEAAPTELRLRFDEPVEAGFSRVSIVAPDGTPLTTAPVGLDPNDPKTIVLPLPKMTPGAYRVHWTTMGHDGHRVGGDVRFSVH